MTDKPYIAEFHDVAKLLDKQRLKHLGFEVKGQRFNEDGLQKLGVSRPFCPSWYAPYSDELRSLDSGLAKECETWAAKVFLTRIADEVASSFRLVESHKSGALAGYRKIWKETPEAIDWQECLVADIPTLSSLVDFWSECNSAQDFFAQFGATLHKLPEDRTVPYNITSLHNHLTLVGKLFRTLEAAIAPDGRQIRLGKAAVSQVEQATGSRVSEAASRGNWLGTLVLIHVEFPQTVVRLADLNVLLARQRAISTTRDRFPDNVLYSTTDSFLAFLPEGGQLTLHSLLSHLVDRGFQAGMKNLRGELGLLASDFDRQYKEFHSRGLGTKRTLRLVEQPYSSEEGLPREIHGRLCEICQVRSSRPSAWLKDEIEEWLCDVCVSIRGMHEPAAEIAAWTGAVMWVKVSLDRDHLLRILPDLFSAYVCEALPNSTPPEIEQFKDLLRPLVPEFDFVQDYLDFAKRLQDTVIADLTGQNLEFAHVPWTYAMEEYPELTVFPVVSSREFLVVCRRFVELMKNMFPRCVPDSPITLALSLSSAKHPYQEHWRFLDSRNDAHGPILIQRANDFRFSLTIPQYEALDSVFSTSDVPTSSALERLAGIARAAQSPNAALFEAFGDSQLRAPLRRLLFENQLPIGSVLSFFKLTTWQEEGREAG